MTLDFAVSLWNYTHYAHPPRLDQIVDSIKKQDLGLEIWATYGEYDDLFTPDNLKWLKPLVKDLKISLHTKTRQNEFDLHKKQIDAAAELGAKILVIHPDDLFLPDSKKLNEELAFQAVNYAKKAQVQLTLENGQFPFIMQCLNIVNDLDFCLDLGHVYLVPETLDDFLEAFIHRITHLHLHDILNNIESHLLGVNGIYLDHYEPGTGGIPKEIWQKLFAKLKDHHFSGTAVFEIHPRDPLQMAVLGKDWITKNYS